MLKDLTLKITPAIAAQAQGNETRVLAGHLGTHFDVMNREFPLDYVIRTGIIFDVSFVTQRDITLSDIDSSRIQAGMFVGFCTGFIETVEYGTTAYYKTHPQLSRELLEWLVEKRVSIIGVDAAGVRRGKEHPLMDQYCADHDVFIVENLCHMKEAIGEGTVYTFPMNYGEMSGLPCRVVIDQ